MQSLTINLKDKSYDIFIKRHIFNHISQFLTERFSDRMAVLINDENLERLYGESLRSEIRKAGLEVHTITITPGEASKSMDSLAAVYERLAKTKITRDDVIITLGGGVTGDLGGFAAATYLRGIPYIQVPTSLLAQVDSSIGGKVAVDLPQGKNLVGSFYHPEAVFIDPELLTTLDKRYLHDGLAEVIKYGCIRDARLFEILEGFKNDEELLAEIEPIIYQCCAIKKSIVEIDERDLGERMLLNFGHTLGHAIEKYFDYKRFTHGEAVAIGMAEITRKSEALGITRQGSAKRIDEVLGKYGLPSGLSGLNRTEILNTVALDKKSSGKSIRLILLNEIGDSHIHPVPIGELDRYL